MSRRPGRNNGYIRKRESRSGKARYEARHEFSDAHGKRLSESQTFATRRDASLWVAERKRRYGQGELSREHRDITLGEYLDVYLARRQAEGLTASSLRDISSVMRLYGAELTPRELRSITSADIDRALSRAMTTPARSGSPRSPKTVMKFRRILSKIFTTALNAGMLDGGNPVDASLRPGRAAALTQTPDAWNREEIQKFFEFCQTAGVGGGRHRHALAFRLLLDTGMRLGELLALRWGDINFHDQTIRIVRSCSRHDDPLADPNENQGRTSGHTKPPKVVIRASLTGELKDAKTQADRIKQRMGEGYACRRAWTASENSSGAWRGNRMTDSLDAVATTADRLGAL